MKEIILKKGEEYLIKFPDGTERYYNFIPESGGFFNQESYYKEEEQ